MKLLKDQPAHAAKGASGAERWMACPGSVALEALFEDQDSPFAAEGSLAHALAETCLLTGEELINYLYWTQSDFDIQMESLNDNS